MNLKELVRAQSSLNQNRQEESDTLCKQAYFLIAEAEAKGFVDKAPLKKAMHLFIQAAKQKRRYSEPYIGLCYLSLLIDQREVATKYLITALQIDPQNEDALRLQAYLNEEPKQQVAEDSFKLVDLDPEYREDVDLDQLYDQLEQKLLLVIKELMNYPPPIPALNEADIDILKNQVDELEQRVNLYEKQIALLDREFDTSELRRRFRPMEVMLKRTQKALEVSERMVSINQQIQGLIDTTKGIIQRLANSSIDVIGRAEKELESLMDSCDWVADQIDAIDSEGHPTHALENTYNILVALIDQAREIIDEHHV